MSPALQSIEFLDSYVIRATLDDGTVNDLDFEPHLWGPMFAPLKDLAVFRSGRVDPEAQTVVWPNGADVAPEVWARGFPESSSVESAS
jgi:Protein of unknown function (DUF2442).